MESRKKRVRIAQLGVVVASALLGYGVDLGAVPAAPSNLTASVNGNTVNLSWSAPAGQVLGYRIEAGTAPGQSNVTSAVTGPATQLSAPGVPSGTYFVRVRAIAGDGEGLASNEVVVTVGFSGPCAAPPSAPTGLTATLNGSTVTFNWASGGGCLASNYILQAGSAPGLSNLAVANVANAQSLTATAPPGTYYVRVVAQNAYGTSLPSNQQIVTVGGLGGGVTLTPMTGAVAGMGYRLLPVTMPATGQYRATLTWADASIDLDLYLTTTACSSYPPNQSCLRAEAASYTGNMEQISYPVQAGQTYYVWVDSFTNRTSNYLVQHTITGGSAATAAQAETPEASDLFLRKPKQ